MKNRLGVVENRADSIEVPYVGDDRPHCFAVSGPEPSKVAFDTRPTEIIKYDHLFTITQETVGQIGPKEAAASNDNDRRFRTRSALL